MSTVSISNACFAASMGNIEKSPGRIVLFAYTLIFPFLILTLTLRNAGDFLNRILPDTPIEALNAVVILTVVYVIHKGLETIGKAAELMIHFSPYLYSSSLYASFPISNYLICSRCWSMDGTVLLKGRSRYGRFHFMRLSLELFFSSSGFGEALGMGSYKLLALPVALVALPLSISLIPSSAFLSEFNKVWPIYTFGVGLLVPMFLLTLGAMKRSDKASVRVVPPQNAQE